MALSNLAILWISLITPTGQGCAFPLFHPLHLSKSVVEYFPQEKVVRISMHIFLDDLEMGINKSGSGPLYLGSTRESVLSDSCLEAYFRQHIRFALDGKAAPLHLLGKELSEDRLAMWCYLEIPVYQRPDKIKVQFTLLTEIFRDQQNILHFLNVGTNGQSALFSRNRTEAVFVIK